jgi:FkbM family methyltransferase
VLGDVQAHEHHHRGGMILRYLKHPVGRQDPIGTLARIARWQLGTRILARPIVIPFVNDSVLVVERGMRGATGCVYVGLSEFHDMLFVAHFCDAGSHVVDIGANVGVYSILAAAIGAKVTALEPVPSAYSSLVRNVRINGFADAVSLLPKAVGTDSGRVRVTSSLGPTNHVLVPGDIGPESLDVQVERLDDLVDEANLIKIDVEGFESAVVAGGQRLLRQPSTHAVLIELNGLGTRYGYSDRVIHDGFVRHGFSPMRYDSHRRELVELEGPNASGNTLYVRHPSAAMDKLRSAPEVRVLGERF